MTPVEKFNALIGAKTVKALKSKNFDAYYCQTKEEALKQAIELIPQKSVVAWGGSMSVEEIGLIDHIKSGDFTTLDRMAEETPEGRRAIELKSFDADVYVMGTNALTQSGTLINIDGIGNRVAALCYGPKSVVIIVGVNKISETEEEAMLRARTVAAPKNAIRLERKTPCTTTGVCHDCLSADCICRSFVITRFPLPGRVKVIIVGESLGF